MSKRDIVERLRDPMIEVDYGDRLLAAEELERLREPSAPSARLALARCLARIAMFAISFAQMVQPKGANKDRAGGFHPTPYHQLTSLRCAPTIQWTRLELPPSVT